jgi:hypothetical protein
MNHSLLLFFELRCITRLFTNFLHLPLFINLAPIPAVGSIRVHPHWTIGTRRGSPAIASQNRSAAVLCWRSVHTGQSSCEYRLVLPPLVRHLVHTDSFEHTYTLNAAGMAVVRYHWDFFEVNRQQSGNGWPSSCDIAWCLDTGVSSTLSSGKDNRNATDVPLAHCGWTLRWDGRVNLASTSSEARTGAYRGRWHICMRCFAWKGQAFAIFVA